MRGLILLLCITGCGTEVNPYNVPFFDVQYVGDRDPLMLTNLLESWTLEAQKETGLNDTPDFGQLTIYEETSDEMLDRHPEVDPTYAQGMRGLTLSRNEISISPMRDLSRGACAHELGHVYLWRRFNEPDATITTFDDDGLCVHDENNICSHVGAPGHWSYTLDSVINAANRRARSGKL